jgi:catechol 2,3-dioxygenase-like lactoylglutathione lyase family enzyme
MFDHVSFKANDLASSRHFYVEALKPLGVTVVAENESFVMLGSPSGGKFVIASGERAAAPVHLAFAAATRAQVREFHAAALAAGGKDNGAPGLRPKYSATYYGAFVFDPNGNNVEAVCRADGE